ncbi:MAG: hypothetical protein AABX01_07590 [Candidatus Micrarchaeota archaeon]
MPERNEKRGKVPQVNAGEGEHKLVEFIRATNLQAPSNSGKHLIRGYMTGNKLWLQAQGGIDNALEQKLRELGIEHTKHRISIPHTPRAFSIDETHLTGDLFRRIKLYFDAHKEAHIVFSADQQ